MRRILRKIAHREEDSLGDVSTLADPAVVPVRPVHLPFVALGLMACAVQKLIASRPAQATFHAR